MSPQIRKRARGTLDPQETTAGSSLPRSPVLASANITAVGTAQMGSGREHKGARRAGNREVEHCGKPVGYPRGVKR